MTLMAARLSHLYNCCHFLCDAWEAETGQDIRGSFGCFLERRGSRGADPRIAGTWRRLSAPVGPCVVLWRRRGSAPHVGLYVRRTVLHLTDHGVIRQLLPVASVGYHSARFYAPR